MLSGGEWLLPVAFSLGEFCLTRRQISVICGDLGVDLGDLGSLYSIA